MDYLPKITLIACAGIYEARYWKFKDAGDNDKSQYWHGAWKGLQLIIDSM